MVKFFLIIVLFFCTILLFILNKKNNTILNINSVTKIPITEHTNYLKILIYYMDKSYDIIYKDRIYIHSLETTRLTQEEINTTIRDFINLTKKFIGPVLLKDFINIYGDEKTLFFNMSEYFVNRYETDELYKSATENMMRGG